MPKLLITKQHCTEIQKHEVTEAGGVESYCEYC
jgi:hypothetical protein